MNLDLAHLKAVFLGGTTDGYQRSVTAYTLFTLGIYIVFAFVQHLEVRLGLIDPSDSVKLTTWNLVGGFGFYALVRSGLNQRIARGRNSSLSIQQSIWAMVGITWAYAITGPVRGAVILIMLLVLIFGVFALNPARSRFLVAVGFAMLASVMVYKALTDPVGYDPRVEAMHLLLAGIVMSAVSALSVRIGKLQQKLEQQRNELAKALQKNQALAACDELTGLANRRTALEIMHQTMASQRASGVTERPSMCLALIDIDHFKRVNDQHGHAAGDEVLRRVAAIGRTVVREDDLLARWGGEEFLLVMPDCTGKQVEMVLAKWRDSLQRESFKDLADDLSVSFSAGIAECHEGTDIESAMASADAAMYAAKHSGRDRIEHSETPLPTNRAAA